MVVMVDGPEARLLLASARHGKELLERSPGDSRRSLDYRTVRKLEAELSDVERDMLLPNKVFKMDDDSQLETLFLKLLDWCVRSSISEIRHDDRLLETASRIAGALSVAETRLVIEAGNVQQKHADYWMLIGRLADTSPSLPSSDGG